MLPLLIILTLVPPAPPSPTVTGYEPADTEYEVLYISPPAPPPPPLSYPPPPPPATTNTSIVVIPLVIVNVSVPMVVKV